MPLDAFSKVIVELKDNMSYQRKFQEDMQRATGRFQDLVQENKVVHTLVLLHSWET